MAPMTGPRSLLLSLAVILLLAGCGSWWQQQQRLARARMAHELCLKRRQQITERLAPLESDQRALQQINAERYVPTPAPQPPDFAQASRYSLLDRELDQERYAKQLDAWHQSESQRTASWQNTQNERRQRLQLRLKDHIQQLAKHDPQLVRAGQPDTAVIARLRRCDQNSALAEGARR